MMPLKKINNSVLLPQVCILTTAIMSVIVLVLQLIETFQISFYGATTSIWGVTVYLLATMSYIWQFWGVKQWIFSRTKKS